MKYYSVIKISWIDRSINELNNHYPMSEEIENDWWEGLSSEFEKDIEETS